jgi:hypothetical protein
LAHQLLLPPPEDSFPDRSDGSERRSGPRKWFEDQ